MRRPCGLRRHACTMTKSPRAAVTITTAPPPRLFGYPCEATATMMGMPPPPRRCRHQRAAPRRHAPHQCIERAAAPRGKRCTHASCGPTGPMGDACVAPTAYCHIVPQPGDVVPPWRRHHHSAGTGPAYAAHRGGPCRGSATIHRGRAAMMPRAAPTHRAAPRHRCTPCITAQHRAPMGRAAITARPPPMGGRGDAWRLLQN